MELVLEEARRRPVEVRRVVAEGDEQEVQGSHGLELVGKESSAGAETARPPTADALFVSETVVELNDYYVALKTFSRIPPDEVFLKLSAISARLAELRGRCWDFDSRRTNALRSRRIDPLIEEVDRQFKIHSRVQATRQFEADLMKGQ